MSLWNRWILVLVFLAAFPYLGNAQDLEPRYELGGVITYTFLREIGSTDSGVGTQAAGLGGRFVYHAVPWVDLEAEINVLPGNPATSGNRIQGLLGVKAGKRWEKGGIFLKARPGFIHFRRDPFGVGAPGADIFSRQRAHSTEPTIDLGGVVEYYTTRGLILRFDLGQSVIRYARGAVRTTTNWQGSFGIGFRF